METHQGFGDKFNMAEMVKKAQAQNKAREANKQNISRPPQQRRSVVIARESASDIESAKDGDYFVGEDGVGAIVIDNEERARKMQENDKTGKALLELVHSDALITDANEYRPNYGENAPEGYDPGVEWMRNNPFDKKTKDMADIKRRFSKLTYGFTGLVDANSPEARIMAEAMEKVRTGEVVLPTPEEFEQQKREAEERKRQRRERLSGNSNPLLIVQQNLRRKMFPLRNVLQNRLNYRIKKVLLNHKWQICQKMLSLGKEFWNK